MDDPLKEAVEAMWAYLSDVPVNEVSRDHLRAAILAALPKIEATEGMRESGALVHGAGPKWNAMRDRLIKEATNG